MAARSRSNPDRTFSRTRADEELQAVLTAAFGAWGEGPDEERGAYLKQLRGPGLGDKVAARLGEPAPDPNQDQSR